MICGKQGACCWLLQPLLEIHNNTLIQTRILLMCVLACSYFLLLFLSLGETGVALVGIVSLFSSSTALLSSSKPSTSLFKFLKREVLELIPHKTGVNRVKTYSLNAYALEKKNICLFIPLQNT